LNDQVAFSFFISDGRRLVSCFNASGVTRVPSADGQVLDIQDTSAWPAQDSGGIATVAAPIRQTVSDI